MTEQLPSEQSATPEAAQLDAFADPNLTAYMEGFSAALDSAAITCARCASLERRIAELEQAMTRVRETLRCTKTAPHAYDADHSCATCGSSSAYAKDLIDEVIRP